MTRLLSSFTLPTVALLAAVGSGIYVAYRLKPEPVRSRVAKIQVALGQPGPANRLIVPSRGLVAGDRVERALDLSNNGAGRIRYLALTSTATQSSLLDRDPVNGLQLRIDRCPRPWTESGPPYTYSCHGRVTTVVSSRPVIGANVPLSRLSELRRGGGTAHLRLTLTLPSSAPSSVGGLTSTIQYDFVGSG